MVSSAQIIVISGENLNSLSICYSVSVKVELVAFSLRAEKKKF